MIAYRQRFTVAHILGHHFAGVAEISAAYHDMLATPNAALAETNQFAGVLLMPREFIEHILYTPDLAQVANLLNVSTMALAHRLEQLKII